MPRKLSSPSGAEASKVARFIRRAASLLGTRADAARIAGVTPQQLQRLIAGTSTGPSITTVLRLADAAGLSLAALQRSSDDRREAKKTTQALARANGLIDALLKARAVDRVTRTELAHATGVGPKVLSRLFTGSHRPADLAAREALEDWMIARGECESCTRQPHSLADFMTRLSRHVQPVTRAPKGSRAPKEPHQ